MSPITREEIQQMKERGYDPQTIGEAEARLQLLEKGLILAEQIRAAFAGVTLGEGVGLYESRGLDDYEDKETQARYRAQDEKEDWQKIPLSDLNSASGGLCFFDAEGMRFHLPAYMIADLRGEYNFGMAFHFTRLSDHCIEQFSLLSYEQRQCVQDFLMHILDDPDYAFDRYKIENALISYWNESN